jgi:hypothetical protein
MRNIPTQGPGNASNAMKKQLLAQCKGTIAEGKTCLLCSCGDIVPIRPRLRNKCITGYNFDAYAKHLESCEELSSVVQRVEKATHREMWVR